MSKQWSRSAGAKGEAIRSEATRQDIRRQEPKAKPVSAVEDVRVEELIAELALRAVLLAQLNKVRHLLIDRFQFRRRRGKEFPAVRPCVNLSQLLFVHGQPPPNHKTRLCPWKWNLYTG